MKKLVVEMKKDCSIINLKDFKLITYFRDDVLNLIIFLLQEMQICLKSKEW